MLDKFRDRALIHVGIHSMLRCSDLRFLAVDDVTDSNDIVGGEYSIFQQKTKKTFTFNLGKMTCKALQAWIEISEKVARKISLAAGKKLRRSAVESATGQSGTVSAII